MNDLIMQNHWKTKHRFQKEDGSDGLMSSKDSVAKYKQVKESDPESLYKDVTDQAGSSAWSRSSEHSHSRERGRARGGPAEN